RPPLLSPQTHPHRRDEEEIERRMRVEEGPNQGGSLPLEKPAHEEREEPAQQQEDHDKDVSDGRTEISTQLAFGNGPDVSPGIHFAASFTVSGMVMLRKTSSKWPSSACNCSICHSCAASPTAEASAPFAPAFGKARTVTRPSFSSSTVTRLTRGNRFSFVVTAMDATPLTRRVTAPAHSDFRLSSCGVPLATILPRSMMIAREQTASTSSRMCVEKMIPFFSPMRRINCRTSCFWFGSSPSVGSSSTSTSGS